MSKRIIILGSGPTLRSYKYENGDTVWCPYSLYNSYIVDKISMFFGMHDYERGLIDNIIDLDSYPLEDIVNKFDSTYFTNTISYMIAYALFIGVDDIEIYGVDMNGEQEYIAERGSVMYWIGYARALGVKVHMASEIDKPAFLYGYEPSKNLKSKINNLRDWASEEKSKAKDKDTRNQYIGLMYGLNLIEREL